MFKRMIPLLLALVCFLTACEGNVPDVSVSELSDAVLSAVDFPATMEEVTSATRYEDDWGLNTDDVEELIVLQSPISVEVYEMVIVKAKEGHVSDILASLEERVVRLRDELTFYPNQVDLASATLVGSRGDYAYLICHEDAQDGEDALLELLQ